jgi:uncharacterized membrane protein
MLEKIQHKFRIIFWFIKCCGKVRTNTRIILTLLDLVKSIDSFASYNLASWKAANPTAIMLGDREGREGGGWERGGR